MNDDTTSGIDPTIDDVEGHKIAVALPDDEDVEGHVQPRPIDIGL